MHGGDVFGGTFGLGMRKNDKLVDVLVVREFKRGGASDERAILENTVFEFLKPKSLKKYINVIDYALRQHFEDEWTPNQTLSAGIRTWPKSDTSFRTWHKHMIGHGPTRELFERARILDLLELTLDIPTFDLTLLSIALRFWGPNYNIFVFPLGPMSVTLRDISALTNLSLRPSISFSVTSQSPIIIGPLIVTIIKEPQSLEPLVHATEKALSPPNKSLAIVAYTLQPQYARPIVLEPEGNAQYNTHHFFVYMDFSCLALVLALVPVEMPIVEEPLHPHDKGKTPAVPEEQSETVVPHFLPKEALFLPKATDEDTDSVLRSIQALFTSWEQVKASTAQRSFSTTRPSTSSISSTKDMNALKKVMLAYTSFMDKDISRSVNIDIDKAKSTLNELSSEVMIEDFMLMSLEAEIKNIQVKIDDWNMRLASKKRNASQEIERISALMARYSEVTVDDPDMVIEELSIVDSHQHFEWSKLRCQMKFILERLYVAGQ
ncbi:hypothetical protein Adt_10743 [Abeliophyllum distichum]|uniref:Aminotransferase-like plant mobile domain-containing protein n=1 Tax=Abeliophyllum distichum TaxID=126358 RepID=A0ABD1UKV4_9LAMI